MTSGNSMVDSLWDDEVQERRIECREAREEYEDVIQDEKLEREWTE